MAAAEVLEKEHNIQAEVIDLRTLRPFDIETVKKSVAKTHRVIIVEEGWYWCGIGAQIAESIYNECFDDLDAPVQRVAALDADALQPDRGARVPRRVRLSRDRNRSPSCGAMSRWRRSTMQAWINEGKQPAQDAPTDGDDDEPPPEAASAPERRVRGRRARPAKRAEVAVDYLPPTMRTNPNAPHP